MDNQIVIELTSRELADALSLEMVGPEILIRGVVPISFASDFNLSFSKSELKEIVQSQSTIIAPSAENCGAATVLVSKHPRLDFARALVWINERAGFAEYFEPPVVHPTARVGQGTVLGNGVRIGAHTVVHSNAVIAPGVIIGEHCVVKSCAVVGEEGFGFERDESGIPVRLVHLGSVKIGNWVEIGSLTTVCRGTLADTIIEDYAKIDDHVHIAHNVKVRRGAMVIACAEVSGGVDVGEFAWIGPNASVIQQVKVGARSLVGIGSNVIRNVDELATVAGNPAKVIGGKS